MTEQNDSQALLSDSLLRQVRKATTGGELRQVAMILGSMLGTLTYGQASQLAEAFARGSGEGLAKELLGLVVCGRLHTLSVESVKAQWSESEK